MRVRLDLKPEACDALAARAVAERRPIDWQAEVMIETGLGLRSCDGAAAGPSAREERRDNKRPGGEARDATA